MIMSFPDQQKSWPVPLSLRDALYSVMEKCLIVTILCVQVPIYENMHRIKLKLYHGNH